MSLMVAGIFLRVVTPPNLLRRHFTARRRSTMASLSPQIPFLQINCFQILANRMIVLKIYPNSFVKLQGAYRGPKPKREWVADWVSKNDDLVRSLPISVGGVSILAVLFNRTVSGIAAVADASSSQSRADLLALGLAVTSILNGLVWLSIRPKYITVVNPDGVECRRMSNHLPDSVVSELLWAWETLSDVTCCRSLVVIYDGIFILQIGFAEKNYANGSEAIAVDEEKLMQGSLYSGAVRSGSQSYLANLSLYPGKSELPFLPSNTQAVILQPLGDKGLAVVGGDTIRGFTTSDQAWITLIGEKLDATLAKVSCETPLAVQKKVITITTAPNSKSAYDA